MGGDNAGWLAKKGAAREEGDRADRRPAAGGDEDAGVAVNWRRRRPVRKGAGWIDGRPRGEGGEVSKVERGERLASRLQSCRELAGVGFALGWFVAFEVDFPVPLLPLFWILLFFFTFLSFLSFSL